MILIHNDPPDRFFGKVSQTSVARAISSLSHAGLKGWLKCCSHANGFQWQSPTLEPDEIKELAAKGFLERGDGISYDWRFDSMGGFPAKELVCKDEPTVAKNIEPKETRKETRKEKMGMRLRMDENAGLMAECDGTWYQVFERDGKAYAFNWENGRYIYTGYEFAEAESLAPADEDMGISTVKPYETEYDDPDDLPF